MGLGWYWIPTPYWGPGWVSWYWGYDYFGWAPLSYYGYPLVIYDNYYYYRYNDRYYPYNSRALTVIHKKHLTAPNVSDVALNQESVKKLGNISLSKSSPPLKLVPGKVSVEKLSENKLLLKKVYPSSSALGTKVTKSPSRTPVQLDTRKIKEKRVQTEKSSQPKSAVGEKKKGSTGVKKKKSEEKKVRKESSGYIKGGIPVYPSSSKISIKNIPRSSRIKKKSSFFRGIYNFITGSSSGKYVRGGTSRGTHKGTSTRKVSSGSRSRSSSSGRSSSGRSSSSGSRSSGSKSGRTKK
jgi:hypothetical protein